MSNERTVTHSERTLVRGIQSWHVTLIALGGIIGSCYFLGLGLVFSEMGAGAVLISYALAGVAIYGVMQSFKELLVNVPRRGSFVSYTREFMGDTASAGIGWAFWANWVCYIPSEALAVAVFANALFFGGDLSAGGIFVCGIIALALLTLINVYRVKWFGHIESIMAIIKIVAIILFCIAGVAIWLGLINNGATISNEFDDGTSVSFTMEKGFIGTKALLADNPLVDSAMTTFQKLFPGGGLIIIIMMIWTLVNFQGSEIVGLAAAETQNPEKNVPEACRKVAVRIIMIYLIPIFILSLIMPYFTATIDDSVLANSVFAQALIVYGFDWGARLFMIVTFVAAFSCANSGFYGTVRSLYGLSVEGLAPKWLSDLNRFNVPQKGTIFTLVFIWFVFLFCFLIEQLGMLGGDENKMYIALIGIAGFTGTLCWVGIIYSQINFRKRLKENGYDPETTLSVKAQWFPGLAWFAFIIQMAAMVLLIFEVSEGLAIFLLSMDIIIAPIVVYQVQKYRGFIRSNVVLGADEVMFDEKYPALPGHGPKPKSPVVEKNMDACCIALLILTAFSIVFSFITINTNAGEVAEGFNMFSDPGMRPTWLSMIVMVATYVFIFWGIVKLDKARKPGTMKKAEEAAGE